ncbi:uroporphyrinogen-III synthase isoform X1 [Aplysia californica]|uniref:Uroporphyrinogen-III synthase isoform X1 n=1 Tax=Aplysia californica TaxID=6500 RepID=A0ABM0ZZM7_APLCA|nr:uroporphyrinogen-III synthase isoform X1 [Aplysia californica]XP_012937824.1 uroporphyrinogen-III synthase isoform X1 [Aplysia californica]
MGDSGKPGNRCVFLFKSPKENETDKYSEVLTSAGFSPVVVPVLSFKFCNETALQTHVAALHLFSAVIFTSTRAVEAVLSVSTGELSRFADITCFVVGQATALAAKKAGFVPTGEETGNAEVLSQLIIKCRDPQDKRPMLFPCSSLRRDTLPDSLSKHDISLTEVVAYETCPNEELQDVLLKSFENYVCYLTQVGFLRMWSDWLLIKFILFILFSFSLQRSQQPIYNSTMRKNMLTSPLWEWPKDNSSQQLCPDGGSLFLISTILFGGQNTQNVLQYS